MKKKLLILLILVISILFIDIKRGYCVEVTDNSSNTNLSTPYTEPSGKQKTYTQSVLTDGITGNEIQAIKVAAYRKDNTRVPGTSIKYIKLYDGYGKNIKNTCSCKNDAYDFKNIKNNANCSCTKGTSFSIEEISGITGSKKYWNTKSVFDTDAVSFTKMMNANNYTNIFKVLDSIGYKYKKADAGYNYQEGDYLIVEPVVTVSCTTWAGVGKASEKKYVTGTINSLIASNMSYFNGKQCGDWIDYNQTTTIMLTGPLGRQFPIIIPWKTGPQTSLYRWVYSAIGQSFKVSGATCNTNAASGHGIKMLNEKNYNGCGYNKWLLDDIVGELPKICETETENGKTTYYDRSGKEVDKDAYTKSCTCYTENNKYYVKYGQADVSKEYFNEACHIDTGCVDRASNNNPYKRMALYTECKDKGCKLGNKTEKADYRNLLNFEAEPTAACTVGENYIIQKSCLTASTSGEFNEKNLSRYTYITDINGKTAYCNTAFTLNSNIGTSWNAEKAGMAYIGGTTTKGVIATANLTVKCYLYTQQITNGDKVDPFSDFVYEDIISRVSLGGQALKYSVTPSNTDIKASTNNGSNYVSFIKTYSVNYYMPEVYIDKITGLIVPNKTNNTKTTYGFYSKFNDNGTTSVAFNIDLGSKSKGITIKNNGNCSYSTTGEIVKNNSLNLTFRTIDTVNPFAGEDGKGRKTGANWCYLKSDGTYDCSSNNQVVQTFIKNRNDSYNTKNQAPKYKIVLDSKTINTIRNYNKNTSIDTYNTTCNDRNVCHNAFFDNIKGNISVGKTTLIP